jgi:uncharacterized lipoprotein YajG
VPLPHRLAGLRLPLFALAAAFFLAGCTQSPDAQMTYDKLPAASESAAPTQDTVAAALPLSSYFTPLTHR